MSESQGDRVGLDLGTQGFLHPSRPAEAPTACSLTSGIRVSFTKSPIGCGSLLVLI